MPEGPEIIWLKEQASVFIGEQVQHARGSTGGYLLEMVAGETLQEIITHGKLIFFRFPAFFLRIHLGFFGTYLIDKYASRKLELELEFESSTLRFYATDCRLLFTLPPECAHHHFDVLHPDFNSDRILRKLLLKPGVLICDALLDQQLFAGMGNGLKNEVLYRRQVHPLSVVGEMPQPVLRSLIAATVAQSELYLEHLREGLLPEYWLAYRKKSCARDGLPLRREQLGRTARSCYYCEACQQLYAATSW